MPAYRVTFLSLQRYSVLDSSVASPRKLKNPTLSVTVVRMIDDDWAGSCRTATSASGTAAPARSAHVIDTTIDVPITAASPVDRPQT
jgi:hypothetical protein